MFKDDDEEEENTFGVTRYPCMPSLVALQQMRNRLHLAFLGRKLMKWTALATGRELRKIAIELDAVYKGYGDDMRNAFILLARSRFYSPQLNQIVEESLGEHAAVVVLPTARTVSGVKIMQYEIAETETPAYEHLGIDKGGQTIKETKKAWLDLLKRLIMMMQLRASFIMIELANKSATKKWNVLSKLVVPRVMLSVRYINSELEEIEREDNFRLKRFKELKIKKNKEKEEAKAPKGKIKDDCCCVDGSKKDDKTDIKNKKDSTCPTCATQKAPILMEDPKSKMIPSKSDIQQKKPDKSKQNLSEAEEESKNQLRNLISYIEQVIDLAKEYKSCGSCNSIDNFISACEDIKNRIAGVVESSKDIYGSCEKIKNDIEDMINITDECVVCQKTNAQSESTITHKYSSSIAPEINVEADVPNIENKTGNIACSKCSAQTKEDTNMESQFEENDILCENCKSKSLATDTQLGHFETSFKELVKVTRSKNEDGTISEQKQIITIKTERNRPSKYKCIDGSKNGSENSTYNKYHDCAMDDDKKKGKIKTAQNASETKSQNKEETILRSCLSPSNLKSKDSNTRTDKVCTSERQSKVTLPPEGSPSVLSTCSNLSKCQSAPSLSVDSSVCCQVKVPSVCINKQALSKETNRNSGKEYSCQPQEPKPLLCKNTQTQSTDAVWRDMATSTTNLETKPSIKSPTPSYVKTLTGKTKKRRGKTDSCCTIKIIAKPKESVSKESQDSKDNDVLLQGSILDALKRLFLGTKDSVIDLESGKSKEMCSCKLEKTPSKRSSLKSQKSSTCKMCQVKIEEPSPEESVMDCCSKNVATESNHNLNEDHICCHRKPDLVQKDNNLNENHSCCHKKPDLIQECPQKSSKPSCCKKIFTEHKSLLCSKCFPTMKDAATLTRRSDRFDVRPVRMFPFARTQDAQCTCHSDTCMVRVKKTALKKCQSVQN